MEPRILSREEIEIQEVEDRFGPIGLNLSPDQLMEAVQIYDTYYQLKDEARSQGKNIDLKILVDDLSAKGFIGRGTDIFFIRRYRDFLLKEPEGETNGH